MVRIIDNTLTAFDENLPSKEELHTFCRLLVTIGVDFIELSVPAYNKMEQLPDVGNYLLNINFFQEKYDYPGFYQYICHYEESNAGTVYEIQINDAREIIKLRTLNKCCNLRIVGLDDLICRPYEKIMEDIVHSVPDCKINFCPENTYGCASALAVLWILNSGKDVTTSFAGCRNNAATEEVLMSLRLAMRYKPNRDLTVLPKLTELYEKIANKKIGNKKSIIGKNIFKVEAGIHADAIYKNPVTYEAFEPKCVGGRTELVIGKHSGLKAVKLKLEELDLPVPGDFIVQQLLQLVKATCTENRKSLNDDEFARLAVEVIADERKQIYC
jgi:homocitrate synthase NifV